jgi:hypothetical protein
MLLGFSQKSMARLNKSSHRAPDKLIGLYTYYYSVGLLDGAMHVWAILYRTTRIKILCMEGGHWNQGE